MSLSERALSALKELGLTGTEVKAYISLLRGGTMTANDVSRDARIPYSKVYEALESLHEKGVKGPLLTSPSVSAANMEQLSRVAEVRARKTMYGGGVIADAREVVLLLGGGDQPNTPLAIWADHHGLASFAKDYFEFLWNSKDTTKVP